MLKIGVCDDNKEIAAVLEDVLYEIGEYRNIKIDMEVFYDGSELINYCEAENRFDILFLDIEMENVDGIEAAEKIREKDNDVLIIFVSSFETYFMKLFEVEPYRFLKKPVSRKEILEVFDKAYDKLVKRGIFFEYTFNKVFVRVPIKDIVMFESKGRVINIYTTNGVDKFYGKLNQIEKDLQSSSVSFLRIHQSYHVNFQFIKAVSYTKVELYNGDELAIAIERQNNVRKQYIKLIGGGFVG